VKGTAQGEENQFARLNFMTMLCNFLWTTLHKHPKSLIVVLCGNVREQPLRSFCRQKVQALGPNDYLRREQSVRWFVHQSTAKLDFPTIVLFTDEACFIQGWSSTATTAIFGKKQTLMLHLFTATN
jgi:hypothetical protein